ncbi:succinate dehydrogenase [ubiquinone] iron-sulfur subunit, mitochondrial-like [Plodia interpunctella]|uniref:succinate dehydrogenase [ubiquinone] iron-sulfur subunit, mitochondrial-like n=1 Tax=Plodia interpunctella TaxID=58824 RepID=UPI002368DF39|nr:succinate dehydrogenase [ubiquinone] iron-sulfur subunit, mitochondrial-like [Plodia interpunctella]
MTPLIRFKHRGLYRLNLFPVYLRHYAEKAEQKPEKVVEPQRIFKLYRFAGIRSKEEPKMQTFELDIRNCGNMLLDAMIKIKDMDPTFTFRRSCREGICGSCAVCLQGHNCLACITRIPNAKTISIHPLPHMYVIRDLVVDMAHFFKGYNSIRPYLIPKSGKPVGSLQYAQSYQDNQKLVGLYECVLCACCSTSCPSYWWNGRRFLGPASLLHAYRWVIDTRDGDTQQRLAFLRDDFMLYRCHTILNCMLACPKGLHPGFAIAKLKRLVAGLDKNPLPEIDPLKYSSGGGGCSDPGSPPLSGCVK